MTAAASTRVQAAVVPRIGAVLAQLWRTSRRLTLVATCCALAIGVSAPLIAVSARAAVNAVGTAGFDWVPQIVLIVVWIALLMVATWLNYGVHTALSLRLGRDVDLTVIDAERRRTSTEHLDTDEIPELAAAVAEQREAIASLPSAVNAVVVLVVGVIAQLVVAATVSALLVVLFAGLGAVAFAAGVAQRTLARVTRRTAASTRTTRSLFALLTAAGPAKDVRTGGTAASLVDAYRQVWDDQDEQLHRARLRGVATAVAAECVLVCVFAVSLVVVLSRPGIDVGAAVLAFIVAVQAAATGGTAHPALSRLGQGLTAYQQYVDLVAIPSTVPTPTITGHSPDAAADVITVSDIVVRYRPDAAPALDGVSLRIRPGTVMAIVGENGGGKSTLVSVLLGLRRPESGTVVFGGGAKAAVFQDFARVESTVAESVAFGAPEAGEAELRRALDLVGAGEWVTGLPHGLSTDVGSASRPGLDLSGGQWQLIALARAAAVRQPRLLVLDEAASNLDAYAEQRLIDTQFELARSQAGAAGCAVVFVTHRLSTARLADEICVLSGGRLVEQGTHQELLDRAGLYAEMYAIQSAGYR